MGWPKVDQFDDGIRPAGKPDECFYCQRKVGEEHKRDCVCVTKKVKLRATVEIEVDVPHFWTEENILFHRNEGSWCKSNFIDELARAENDNGCLCPVAEFEFIEVTDETPKRELKPTESPASPIPQSPSDEQP